MDASVLSGLPLGHARTVQGDWVGEGRTVLGDFQSENFMKKTPKPRNPISAESIAKRAERGQNVSRYFTNAGRMMPPVQRVNVDFAQDMLRELDLAARELNVSRQAVIKIFVRQALNQHYLAQRARYEKTSSKRA